MGRGKVCFGVGDGCGVGGWGMGRTMGFSGLLVRDGFFVRFFGVDSHGVAFARSTSVAARWAGVDNGPGVTRI